MHNVQIAIQDEAYAQELRRLLVSDGNHRVQVVDRPSPALTGVVVVDETLIRHSTWREEPNITRYLVLANEPCDADELWEIGIRQVVPAHYHPSILRIVVLAAEVQLKTDVSDGSALPEEARASDLRGASAQAEGGLARGAKATDAFNRSGPRVQVNIGVAFPGAGAPSHDSASRAKAEPDSAGTPEFDAVDRLFLQLLRISVS